MSIPTDSNRAAATRTKPASLVWLITLGEALLVGAAAFALSKYWMMLPVPWRWGAASGLGLLALVGIYRLVKYYLRRKRQARDHFPQMAMEHRPDLRFQTPVNGVSSSTVPPAPVVSREASETAKPATTILRSRMSNPTA